MIVAKPDAVATVIVIIVIVLAPQDMPKVRQTTEHLVLDSLKLTNTGGPQAPTATT